MAIAGPVPILSHDQLPLQWRRPSTVRGSGIRHQDVDSYWSTGLTTGPLIASHMSWTPGLGLDKIKTVLATAWPPLAFTGSHEWNRACRSRGWRTPMDAIFQDPDRGTEGIPALNPVSIELKSLQRKGHLSSPDARMVTWLPMLKPALVASPTFSARMVINVVLRDGVRSATDDSREAIRAAYCQHIGKGEVHGRP